MGLDPLNGSSGAQNITGARRSAANPVGGAAPGMAADSLSLSSSQPSGLQKEIATMTPKEAESNRKTGGMMIGAGMLGVMGAYFGAGALAAAGFGLAAPIIGVAAAGLALWGAMKFAKGVSASIQQTINKAQQGVGE